jgi:hypothetical protein
MRWDCIKRARDALATLTPAFSQEQTEASAG